jgi:site-specific DNA-methyltransferase (adenine-specific)
MTGAVRAGGTTVYRGDCLDVMTTLAGVGTLVDSIVTDPPYHLTTTKRFGGDGAPAQYGTDGLYQRASRGFMGKEWDGGDIAFRPETWRRCYDLLKPGGYLLAFSGSRTYHRMACAIEDAGFEIRDQLMWLYGTGFPKSHDVSKATDAAQQWEGWGTALKPAHEPIVMARKPLDGTVAANVLTHGVGAINIDACRLDVAPRKTGTRAKGGEPTGTGSTLVGSSRNRQAEYDALNKGRFPANVLHDGSDEVIEAFAAYGERGAAAPASGPTHEGYSKSGSRAGAFHGMGDRSPAFHADQGTAARFFYTAKASKRDRCGSKHPTVKPIALIEYLCRMVTRPGGVVLDPFAGSGTLADAWPTSILIEREGEYFLDIMGRLARRDGEGRADAA